MPTFAEILRPYREDDPAYWAKLAKLYEDSREYLESEETDSLGEGTVAISDHALNQMFNRNLTLADVLDVVVSGRLSGIDLRGMRRKNDQTKLVVVTVENRGYQLVVTAFTQRRKKAKRG